MKKILVLVLMLSITQVAFASYTRGYYRSNGTYVNGYHRTRSDYTKLNNYSTRGNSNPFTGKRGSINPRSYSNTYRTRPYKKL